MRALLYVQHLLGTGHLKRTVLIAGELRELGVDVHLITGGMPVDVINTDHLTVHQLEPVRAADSTFSSACRFSRAARDPGSDGGPNS